jgi:dGTP triphosphohydrolase
MTNPFWFNNEDTQHKIKIFESYNQLINTSGIYEDHFFSIDRIPILKFEEMNNFYTVDRIYFLKKYKKDYKYFETLWCEDGLPVKIREIEKEIFKGLSKVQFISKICGQESPKLIKMKKISKKLAKKQEKKKEKDERKKKKIEEIKNEMKNEEEKMIQSIKNEEEKKIQSIKNEIKEKINKKIKEIKDEAEDETTEDETTEDEEIKDEEKKINEMFQKFIKDERKKNSDEDLNSSTSNSSSLSYDSFSEDNRIPNEKQDDSE